MDPYDILGIRKNATQEEIKKAYRREAMKWHPDRCNNSAEAKERFHQAAEAYKFLSENYSRNGDDADGKHYSSEDRYQSSASGQSDNYSHARYSRDQSEDKFADTVFWEVMLDFAIKLAQTGLNENEISNQLCENGCQQKLAAIIADKAFNIHAHYAAGSSRKRKQGADKSTFKEERLEAELQRAFIGGRNIFLSPRDTIEYYLVVFSLLALMLVWTAYRKLWLLTLVFWLIYLPDLAIFSTYAPQALDNDYLSILPVAILCFTPFIFIAMFGNYFYYRKARKIIRAANHLFTDHQDKIVWIKNNAGTSSTAAFVFAFVFSSSLVYLEADRVEILDSIDFNLSGVELAEDDAISQKAKSRLKEAGQFFEIAESHFNSSPPDYMKASMAYSTAANNGSLLAAYKLGYMHYAGIGFEQNDVLALNYFKLATRTSLAFQPHSLQLTTEFLAESYNNLGIMYQDGYGTKRNTKKALEMYRKAVEFGSHNAQQNLATIYTQSANSERRTLTSPSYE